MLQEKCTYVCALKLDVCQPLKNHDTDTIIQLIFNSPIINIIDIYKFYYAFKSSWLVWVFWNIINSYAYYVSYTLLILYIDYEVW